MVRYSLLSFIFVLLMAWTDLQAQNNSGNKVTIAGQSSSRRVITTSVPFLMIAPDARAGGMGEVGVSTVPDANSAHWNAAKLAFVDQEMGFSLNYTPWLGRIIDDMSISYLSGYYKISREQAIGIHIRYFDLGDITFNTGPLDVDIIGQYNPREFTVGGTYSRVLIENTLGIGISARFIHSNLTGNIISGNSDAQAGKSVAADVGVYYNKDILLSGNNSNITFGASINNIGAKLTYSNEDFNEFIPTNLRLGSAFTTNLDPYNSLTFAMDFNKLMVPTPPIYELDENGNLKLDGNEDPIILDGKDPDRPLLAGMFGSFADAPDGFSEELKEVMIAFGTEYWYNDVFAARAGYFYEDREKGNRKFFTLGLGFRYQVFGIDFAYLIPQERQPTHPLAETLRFGLVFNFEGNPNKTVRE